MSVIDTVFPDVGYVMIMPRTRPEDIQSIWLWMTAIDGGKVRHLFTDLNLNMSLLQ